MSWFDSVFVPLEMSINGVQNMRYMSSSATSAGEATIIIYFKPGTGTQHQRGNVQNRVNPVLFQLPPLVVREGIIVSQVGAQHADVRQHFQYRSPGRPERTV